MESFKNSPEDQNGMWDQALEFAHSGNMEAAKEILLHLAGANFKGAAYLLGRILSEPVASGANVKEAMYWLQKAVDDEKDVEAMLVLASLYVANKDANSAIKAVKLIEQAADAEDIGALTTLGSIHEDGYMDIVLPNTQTAESYFVRAAKQEGVWAMLRLSSLYWKRQNFYRWLYWRIKAISTTIRIAIVDPEDDRLRGVKS